LPGWHPWEDYRQGYAARKALGGGVVNTLSHPLDYVRWLFGDVHAISAVTGKLSRLELNVEDVAEITLRMENGCMGSIHLDYFQRPPAHWLEITCEQGHIRWDNNTGSAKIYHIVQDDWENINPPIGFERNDLFLAEMQAFIKRIQGKSRSGCSLQDGIKVLELTEAVHASARQGCTIYL
jgi:predicted dehydrogenase